MFDHRSKTFTQLISSLSSNSQNKGYYALKDLHYLIDHAHYDDREVPLYLIYYFVLDIEFLTKK